MAEPYDLTPIPKKKLKKLQKKLKGKGGSPYEQPDFDFFGKDNDGPV
tara:strand:- start:52 stop:192 length:141 start_codon:yes stop_codon:yes gene_type:complete